MRIADMNEHQKAAYRLTKEQYNSYIGGLENGLMDTREDEEEHQSYKTELADPEGLIETIYQIVIKEANRIGFAKHIRFAGTDWIKYRIAKFLYHDGYNKNFQENPDFER